MADPISPDMVDILTGNRFPSLPDFRKQKGVTSREFGVYLFAVIRGHWIGFHYKREPVLWLCHPCIGLVGRVEKPNCEGILAKEPNSELAKVLWDGIDKEVVVVTVVEIIGSQNTPTGYERQHRQFVSVLFEHVHHDEFGTWKGPTRNKDSQRRLPLGFLVEGAESSASAILARGARSILQDNGVRME